MKILVSACLLGQKVRYDGNDNFLSHQKLNALNEAGKIIPFCPEMAGGLSTPRPPAEIQANGRIVTTDGQDVTDAYLLGAQKALALAQKHNIRVAILKARSPSCGNEQIYDGTFSKTLTHGMGATAALLHQNGIQVFNEHQVDEAINISCFFN